MSSRIQVIVNKLLPAPFYPSGAKWVRLEQRTNKLTVSPDHISYHRTRKDAEQFLNPLGPVRKGAQTK